MGNVSFCLEMNEVWLRKVWIEEGRKTLEGGTSLCHVMHAGRDRECCTSEESDPTIHIAYDKVC